MAALTDSRLFKPITIGNITLSHRMGLCPLTRYRSSDDHTPVDSMIEYYSQRASVKGTLLVTEGTFISKADGGYANAPGIYSQDQIKAWRKVTDAVHAKGSYIFCQLWALGRTADPEVSKKEGIEICSSDSIPIDADSVQPRRLTLEEISGKIQNYVNAAKNAIEAGFDGVELHGAHGYLIDQFIQDCANRRDDEYGGSIENRSRFAVEAVRAVSDAIGPEKTAIRLNPWTTFNGMRMEDPIPQFSDVIRKLSKLKIAYLHLVQSRGVGSTDSKGVDELAFAYDLWDGPILVADGFNAENARRFVDETRPDKEIVVMFGRYFISTPDLPFRIQHRLELAEYNRDTFYTPKSLVGYTDYPFSPEFLASLETKL